MSRARDLAALVIPDLFQQNAGRNQLGLGTDTINAKIQVSGAVSATTYYGDGSNLTGVKLDPGSSQNITNLNVTGIATFSGDVNISTGSTVFGGNFDNTVLTGVTTIAGQVSAGEDGSTGNYGQVLISVGSGVSWTDPVGIRTEAYITAVGGETAFNFQHDPNALDVYLNGIKLQPDEFSSNGGTVVSISTATKVGDELNFVGFGVSGFQGQVGSLTVKDDGQIIGNVGGINIINFQGRDTSVTGAGNSISVNIPNRKGFVDSRDTRAYVSHDDVGTVSTIFSFLPIASSITYDNTDVYVAGYKKYIDTLDLGYSKYVGIPTGALNGTDVIIVGYKNNDVRAGIASTAVQDQVVFAFPSTGIGTPGRISSGRPIDVYYSGVKLVENETYVSVYGNSITLNPNVNVFAGDIGDIFNYANGAKVGLGTITSTDDTNIIEFPATSSTDLDVVINGIKLPYRTNTVGITSAIELVDGLKDNDNVIINSYDSANIPNAKIGISTRTVGVGETVFFGTLDDEHFVNGVKILGAEIDSVGVTSIVSLRNVPEVGSIAENVRYDSNARTGIATISAVSIGQTVFSDTSVTFSKDSVDVFFNGVKLTASEFSIVGTSSIVTLTNGVGADSIGDTLEVIRWGQFINTNGTFNTRYGITTFTAGAAQTDFAITDPADAIATNQVFLNGVYLDGGGGSPEYTIINGVATGTGVTVQLAAGAEAGDVLEVIGITTGATHTNRNVTTATVSQFYTYDIDLASGDQESYVNGVRVLGAERETYAAGEYVNLTTGSVADSVFETFRYASGVRVGVTTTVTTPSFTLNTTISAPGVGAGITEFIVASVANVTVGSTMIITGAGSTFAQGVNIVSVGATSVFIGTASTISNAIAAGVAATITSGVGVSVYNVAAPLGVADNDVYINGIIQAPSDYTSIHTVGGGTTITFATAPFINNNIEIVGIATTARTVNEDTASINENIFTIGHSNSDNEVFVNGIRQEQVSIRATFAPNTYVILEEDGENLDDGDEVSVFEYASWARTGITTFAATEGQTQFTVGIPTGTTDNDVYVNGVRLATSDFSVIGGGNTIGLTTSTNAGDIVEIVGIATTARIGIATERVFAVDGQSVIPIGDQSDNVEVYVNGVRYFNSQFTTNVGDSLLIDVNPYGAAAQAGDHIELIEYNSDGQQLGKTEANYKAFSLQTEFQIEYQDKKLLDVYVNGLLKSPESYNAETGTNIVFNVGLNAGDLVQLITYTTTEITEWTKTSVGIYQTAPYVGVGTDAIGEYQLQVGYPGIAGTTLWVEGNARVTGILTVGDTNTITIDGDAQQIRIGNTIINSSGIAATTFTGDIVGTASTAESLTPTASINTSGIITATGGFVGDITGTATTATTALGFSTDVSINSTGILTATQVDAGIGSFRDAVVSGAITATTVSATSIVGPLTGNVTGTATGLSGAPNIVVTVATAGTFIGNLTGTASTAENALGLSTSANINTTGIITATFIGDLTGTATTATTALGFSTTASINTSGIITAGTFVGDVTGTVNGTASIAQVALGITNTQIGIVSATEAIIAGFTTLSGSASIGGDLTGSGNIALQDSGELRLGTGNDFVLSFDGTQSIIQDSGAGTLKIRVAQLDFEDGNGINTHAKFNSGGGSELNFSGTKRFETVALGASVTGSLEITENLNVTGLGTILGNVRLDADLTLLGDNNTIGIGTGYSVGVGTLTPAADAILELKSTDKFFIVSRMTTAQRDGVASTTSGAIIYNTTVNRHQGYNGTAWNNFYV